MGIFDIIVVTIILVSCLFGLYKGMIHLLVNFIGFIASLIVAFVLYPKIKVVVASYFNNEAVVAITSGISSYMFSLVFFTFICSSIIMMVSPISQGLLDRLLGLVAGFIRGAIIALVLYAIVAVFATKSYQKAEKIGDIFTEISTDKYPDWLKDSMFTKYLDSVLKDVVKMIPDRIIEHEMKPTKTEKDEFIDDMKEKINESTEEFGKEVEIKQE
ncbi:MAG: CvpA family protein [Rickettsiales bacterium]|uniref:CvpA family protein n=1 Tax=Accumulibacter sp. TaxID=2053492 RepID=UPI001AC6CD78|nr:CvpA family protein [Accumulibacter sp.]MBN8438843.1 CvpA family protein [Accumulibacter sp.]MBN8512261.1 CvpA family protein [Rickettsiales bacterium]MCA0254287.1 CvpA family protein [Pseudomonadota bacterium]